MAVVKSIEKINIGSTADVGRDLKVSRQTASKYLSKAEELGLVEKIYEREDTKLYAKKDFIQKGSKSITEIEKETRELFKKYPVID